MPRLPGIDWPEFVSYPRFEFLRSAARFVPPPEDAGEDGLGVLPELRSAPSLDHDALSAAADLAFAIGRTAEGMDCLKELVADLFDRDLDLRLAALPGAIAGAASTRPSSAGFEIDPVPRPQGLITYQYPRPLRTPEGLSLTLDLILASLASGTSLKDLWRSAPGGEWWVTPGEPIVQALGLFDTDDDDPQRYARSHAALWMNAAHWREDLALHRRDSYHWDEARVRGALIDTRWLAFEIAVRKWDGGAEFLAWRRARPFEPGVDELDKFIGELADEILQVAFQPVR